ncbi:hypothetical protein Pmani_013649 [Petrolisthes manimaculis]|uniref:Secreted protein n=1 Tax=Petrolisthes manimaculis TaxID=1843537 RepID=A0AAE1UDW3_9EUCA|nr:hypothetical protein Pmani_013649 [Petrolisthes manimaculis]
MFPSLSKAVPMYIIRLLALNIVHVPSSPRTHHQDTSPRTHPTTRTCYQDTSLGHVTRTHHQNMLQGHIQPTGHITRTHPTHSTHYQDIPRTLPTTRTHPITRKYNLPWTYHLDT